MERKEEFEAQLRRNDLQTVQQLLTSPEKETIREFYETHFDEIKSLIANCRNLRTVVEDLYALEPSMTNI